MNFCDHWFRTVFVYPGHLSDCGNKLIAWISHVLKPWTESWIKVQMFNLLTKYESTEAKSLSIFWAKTYENNHDIPMDDKWPQQRLGSLSPNNPGIHGLSKHFKDYSGPFGDGQSLFSIFLRCWYIEINYTYIVTKGWRNYNQCLNVNTFNP